MDIPNNILSRMPEEIQQEMRDGTCSQSTLNDMKAQALNEKRGSLHGIDCAICNNKGFIALIADGDLVTTECTCMKRRRTLSRIAQSGLSDLVSTNTFQTYETPKKWHQVAKETAMNYLVRGDGKWFIISGNSGTGKTHLCTAICGELIKAGKEVRYMLWRDEAPRLKALVNDRFEYDRLISEIKRADVLYIDDFWKGAVTPADINLAFEILNARYNSKQKVTLISSERTIEQILSVDEAIGSRIYARSKGFYIKTPDENWRLR